MKREEIAFVLGICVGLMFIIPFIMAVVEGCPYRLVYPYFKEPDYIFAGWGFNKWAWVIREMYVQEDGKIFAPHAVTASSDWLVIKYGCVIVLVVMGLRYFRKSVKSEPEITTNPAKEGEA